MAAVPHPVELVLGRRLRDARSCVYHHLLYLMRQRPTRPQTKRKIPIYDEDWEYLLTRFGKIELGIGAGPVIRELVHRRVREMQNKESDIRDREQDREQEYLS